MTKTTAVLISSFGAIVVQPLVFIASFGAPMAIAGDLSSLADIARYSFFAALFAIPFVIFVGIPATLFLAHLGTGQLNEIRISHGHGALLSGDCTCLGC